MSAARRPAVDQLARHASPPTISVRNSGKPFAAAAAGDGGQRGRRDQQRASPARRRARRPAAHPSSGPGGGTTSAGPGRQRHAQFQHRGVEAGRGELQHPVPAARRRTGPPSAAEKLASPAWRDRHALGLAGRARGVDDVGQDARDSGPPVRVGRSATRHLPARRGRPRRPAGPGRPSRRQNAVAMPAGSTIHGLGVGQHEGIRSAG